MLGTADPKIARLGTALAILLGIADAARSRRNVGTRALLASSEQV